MKNQPFTDESFLSNIAGYSVEADQDSWYSCIRLWHKIQGHKNIDPVQVLQKRSDKHSHQAWPGRLCPAQKVHNVSLKTYGFEKKKNIYTYINSFIKKQSTNVKLSFCKKTTTNNNYHDNNISNEQYVSVFIFREQAGRPKCPVDPFFIMPDKCSCVDFQVLKLQELPDHIPQGEMPRHLQVYCDRYLCDRVVPGNRVLILGIYSIKKVAAAGGRRDGREKALVGVRAPYIRVVGISVDGDNTGSGTHAPITNDEEDMFRRLAADPDVYERIARSVAPSIFGALDIKKAIACLLFGGSRKRMPDGLCRRGDINVLMLGDPGTAKSQLLKFVETVAPIGIYTSGKGSSAAGLTASVTRDPVTVRRYLL